jgi:hypothetical protein
MAAVGTRPYTFGSGRQMQRGWAVELVQRIAGGCMLVSAELPRVERSTVGRSLGPLEPTYG